MKLVCSYVITSDQLTYNGAPVVHLIVKNAQLMLVNIESLGDTGFLDETRIHFVIPHIRQLFSLLISLCIEVLRNYLTVQSDSRNEVFFLFHRRMTKWFPSDTQIDNKLEISPVCVSLRHIKKCETRLISSDKLTPHQPKSLCVL